ncbi:DUF3667 domain-containing protein [Bizionia sediminis]|uniref:DUF3667 domain-containing protein n=1 Tax=Bizionia sediminis TaxID=1737064 RepID=A0ABW5KR10_9FLAO
MAHSNYICKNCGSFFNDRFAFCPHCGQKRNDKLTLKVLFYNTISNYFSFDARFFKSFFPLVLKPGFLAEKFIEGKRLLYLHPAQMYLFSAIVFFFLNSFKVSNLKELVDADLLQNFERTEVQEKYTTNDLKNLKIVETTAEKARIDSTENTNVLKTFEDANAGFSREDEQVAAIAKDTISKTAALSAENEFATLDSLIAINAPMHLILKEMGLPDDAGIIKTRIYKQGLKFYKVRKAGGLIQKFFDALPIAMFFVLPLFALILFIVFRNVRNYAHHLVFSFYYFSFLFTVFSFILIVNYIFQIPGWLDWIIVVCTFLYLVHAMKRFYKQSAFKSYIKASLTMCLFFPVVLISGMVVLGFAFMFA